jgi:DNA-binding NarL/FixJ family response regulator
MIKLFIIDDHTMIIEGIHSLLESENEIVWTGSANLPEDLMLHLKHDQPDVLLMDINLPQKSGLDLCLEVKAKYPAINIIGLSTSDQASVIRKMTENGAVSYLLKDASKTELISAIKMAAEGKNYMNLSVAQVLKNNMPESDLPLITKREKEVLALIAEGLTNPEIAAKLFLSVTTVDSHRKNMLTKFKAKNSAALVKLAVTEKLI